MNIKPEYPANEFQYHELVTKLLQFNIKNSIFHLNVNCTNCILLYSKRLSTQWFFFSKKRKKERIIRSKKFEEQFILIELVRLIASYLFKFSSKFNRPIEAQIGINWWKKNRHLLERKKVDALNLFCICSLF